MAINLENVQRELALLAGEDLSEETDRAALCLSLCGQAAEGVRRRLAGREDQAAEYAGALEGWAAAEAFLQLTLADEAAGPESLTADGVRIDAGERSAKARALAAERRRAVAPLLGEEAFYFGQV